MVKTFSSRYRRFTQAFSIFVILAGNELLRGYQAMDHPALDWVRNRVTLNENPVYNSSLISARVINADALGYHYTVFTYGMALGNGIARGQGLPKAL